MMRKIKLSVMLFATFGLAIFGLANSSSFTHFNLHNCWLGTTGEDSQRAGQNRLSAELPTLAGANSQLPITAPPRYVPGRTYQVGHTIAADASRRRFGAFS